MNFEDNSASATAPALDKQLSTTSAPNGQSYPDLDSILAALEHERIATVAYYFWQQRGCPIGSPDEDWAQAVRYIRDSR
jgi:Protein of unknown function (DUF2934)